MEESEIEKSKNLAGPSEINTALIEIEHEKLKLDREKLQFWDKRLGEIIPTFASYYEKRMLSHETPILKTSIWILAGIVILIVVGTGFLVYIGKLDAASFTFVIGTVLGYLLSFSKMFLKKERDWDYASVRFQESVR